MRLILVIFGLMFCVTVNGQSPINMNNWMGTLASHIQDRPMTEIFLPGSHDSATYKLENKFGKNQSISEKLNNLRFIGVGFIVTGIAKNWAQAQNQPILVQLMNGIRYLDLRIIYRDSKKDFYTVHGLYGPSLNEILPQIALFLQNNPKEIIVIQVGDLGYMPHGDKDHHELIKRFQTTLGSKLVPKSLGLDKPIKTLLAQGRQVILIYGDNKIADQYDNIFSTNHIRAPWANKVTARDLKKALDDSLSGRSKDKNQFYVIQSQLTPSTDTIKEALKKPFSDNFKSLEQMANAVKKELPLWINDWRKHGPTIIMTDYVDKDISEKIVNLNKSLN